MTIKHSSIFKQLKRREHNLVHACCFLCTHQACFRNCTNTEVSFLLRLLALEWTHTYKFISEYIFSASFGSTSCCWSHFKTTALEYLYDKPLMVNWQVWIKKSIIIKDSLSANMLFYKTFVSCLIWSLSKKSKDITLFRKCTFIII